MKQCLFLLAAFILIFSFSSCNKQYSCQCVRGTGEKITPLEFHSNTRKHAKKECEDYSVGVPGQSSSITCVLL